ncbi:PREDICTED: general odorant-binding protein 56a [Bactrocera latifrons]|uniref:General odorant-binding protein 56a n=1 Tax=Bactrocera latifrons TaxID=174628 RepID=A0A0K8VID3_BACLA|nr:PREDICTED: general odorant-binding protein 56a [Bactrocera latifrons]
MDSKWIVLAGAILASIGNLPPFPAVEARSASVKMSLDLSVSEDQHRKTADMVRLCALETDLSMDDLRRFSENDFSNVTKATQCFTHCLFEHMGLVSNGIFVERDIISFLGDVTDPKRMLERECLGHFSDNKCETAFLIHQCYQSGQRLMRPPYNQPEPVDQLNEEPNRKEETRAMDLSTTDMAMPSAHRMSPDAEHQLLIKNILAKRLPRKQNIKQGLEEE